MQTDKPGIDISRSPGGSPVSSRRLVGGAVLALVLVPLSVALAYDGRRMTLGANRPEYEPPTTSMPYDQAAALPSYPPLSRPAEPLPQALSSPAPATVSPADSPAIRIDPPTVQAQAEQPQAPAASEPAKAEAPKSNPTTAPKPAIARAEPARMPHARAAVSRGETRATASATRVTAHDGRVQVDAPTTKVAVRDSGRVRVDAPHTYVAVDDGRVRVRAPFVNLDIRF